MCRRLCTEYVSDSSRDCSCGVANTRRLYKVGANDLKDGCWLVCQAYPIQLLIPHCQVNSLALTKPDRAEPGLA